MPASFESSAAIDAINKVPLSNGAECGSEKSAIATGATGWPNHPLTNFIAGSSALEYFAAPFSWPGRLNNSKGALDWSTYSAIAKVGVTVPSGLQPHSTRIPISSRPSGRTASFRAAQQNRVHTPPLQAQRKLEVAPRFPRLPSVGNLKQA